MSNQMLNSTKYQHSFLDGSACDLPVGKAVCVGRNYLDHIQELNNSIPQIPILFIKPSTSIVDVRRDIVIPTKQGQCHNELELCFLISNTLTNATEDEVARAIAGVGLALDLTLRDEQQRLKESQHPWERAKSFDGACPMSPYIKINDVTNLESLSFSLEVNGEVRQQGHSDSMIISVLPLIAEMSKHFTLLPGDTVLTGTPKGVGPLFTGDQLTLLLTPDMSIQTSVV